MKKVMSAKEKKQKERDMKRAVAHGNYSSHKHRQIAKSAIFFAQMATLATVNYDVGKNFNSCYR